MRGKRKRMYNTHAMLDLLIRDKRRIREDEEKKKKRNVTHKQI
jgi:hypothetical protein